MPPEVLSRLPEGETRPNPILLVHGLWHAAWAWEGNFLDTFAAHGYATYAVSLSGHGNSPGSIRTIGSRRMLADLESVARSLPAPPILIGHSMGGYMVQKYLERNTAPAAVLLAGVPYYGVWHSLLKVLLTRPHVLLEATLTWNLRPVVKTPERVRHFLFTPDTPDVLVRQIAARVQDDSYPLFLDMLLFNLPRPAKITTPLLIVGGEQDNIVFKKQVEDNGRRYGSPAIFFPKVGHELMLEPGWEEVAEHILRWLHDRGL